MAWEYTEEKKVYIAILLPHTGNLPSEFVEKTWGPLRFKSVEWCDKLPLMCRVPSLPLARNILAQKALDAGVDYLFWIDSDHVFEKPEDPNEALKFLYLCDSPIVAGLYRAKQKTGFGYAAWIRVREGYTPIQEWTGNFITVDVTGLGCCLIKREVFEKIPKPWFSWEREDAVSEDFYFFEKAKEVGYEVKIFTDVRLSHIGTLKVKIDGEVTTLDI